MLPLSALVLFLQASFTCLAVVPLLNGTTIALEAERLLPRFKERCGHIQPYEQGVFPSEALALVATTSAAAVEVLIESGTAQGFSAEMFASFFDGSGVQIYTIDDDRMGYERKHGFLTEAQRRLRPYNATVLLGDSFQLVPELLARLRHRRVGLFFDGPSGDRVLEVCRDWLGSGRIAFCALHDTAPFWGYGYLETLATWERTVLRTYRPSWRSRFSHLDGVMATLERRDWETERAASIRRFGAGLVVVA